MPYQTKEDKHISMTDAVALIAAYDKVQTMRKEEEQGIYASDLPWPFCYKNELPWRMFASAFTILYINQVLALVFGIGTSEVLGGFIPIWFCLIFLWIPILGSATCSMVCLALWLMFGPVDHTPPPVHQETEYERKYQ